MDERVIHDPLLAHQIFPQVAQEWYGDMQAHCANLSDESEKTWFQDVFIPSSPEIREERGHQVIYPGGSWSDLVRNETNGFASLLSISRDAGGTLYINSDEKPHEYFCPPLVNFSPEKFKAYVRPGYDMRALPGAIGFTYDQHNIDYTPGALFLRNWALAYHNEALKSSWTIIEALQQSGELLKIVK